MSLRDGRVTLCRSCGARYPHDRFACTACDVGLVEDGAPHRVLALEGEGLAVPVGERTFQQRTELVDLLARDGIHHRWDGGDLVVGVDDVAATRLLVEAGPMGEDEEAEVGYELDDWLPEQQADLVARLAAEGIPNRWEGTEIVVPEAWADRVEEVIDEIDHPDAIAVDDDEEGGDGGGELLGALFVAADVLQHDPSDPAAVADLLEAAERADVDGVPYGLDVAVWDGVRRMAGDVADLLAEHADEERVAAAARALRDALREMV